MVKITFEGKSLTDFQKSENAVSVQGYAAIDERKNTDGL